MYNKEKVKEGLKKIRCIYKELDQFRAFYIYKGTYEGWPWSLTVIETAGEWKYELHSISGVFVDGESTTLSHKEVHDINTDYKKLILAVAVAAYEVVEKYDLWRKSYDFDYPAEKR